MVSKSHTHKPYKMDVSIWHIYALRITHTTYHTYTKGISIYRHWKQKQERKCFTVDYGNMIDKKNFKLSIIGVNVSFRTNLQKHLMKVKWLTEWLNSQFCTRTSRRMVYYSASWNFFLSCICHTIPAPYRYSIEPSQ